MLAPGTSDLRRQLQRADRERANFWRSFELAWGLAGEPPETYWQPWLGHICHLRPQDLGEMTPYQLEACREYAEAIGGADG